MSYVASMTSMYIGLGTMILIRNSHDFPLPLCVGFGNKISLHNMQSNVLWHPHLLHS